MPENRHGGVTTHRVQRSLAHLTVSTQLAMRERERQNDEIRGGETEQQYKVLVTGVAGDLMAWQTTEITFDAPFIAATDLRDADFDTPLFTFGAEMQSRTPVIVTAVITGWLVDEDGAATGVRLAIGAHNPAGGDVKFEAIAHLLFEGWAGTVLDDDEG
jgi:hypothetical protein